MTSGSTFPQRFTKIDELTRPDHSYLTPEDTCYFLGEYSARKGFAFSPTNNLVINFKKPPTVRGTAQWPHKERAIAETATAFRNALPAEALNQLTFVPIPPSKTKTDPLYDDRMVQMLRAIRPTPPLDIRELIVQTASTAAAHEQADRPRPEQLVTRYHIDAALLVSTPTLIALVDDVLTTGAHFKAGQTVLQTAFPGARVVGLFIARRVPEASDVEDFI
jgi:hypothetical protein